MNANIVVTEESLKDQNHFSSQIINTTDSDVSNELLLKPMNGWSSDGIHINLNDNKEDIKWCEESEVSETDVKYVYKTNVIESKQIICCKQLNGLITDNKSSLISENISPHTKSCHSSNNSSALSSNSCCSSSDTISCDINNKESLFHPIKDNNINKDIMCLRDKLESDLNLNANNFNINNISFNNRIVYVNYESEKQMPDIMRLIQKDLSEPYSIYTYRYFIHNWPHLCFLAMDGHKSVGAIVCKLDLHKKMVRRGYIAMLAVDENYRKMKIGSNLVLRAIQAMVCGDADEVVLETEVTNKPALQLYENLGFVRDKRLFRYYLNGVDALRLKLWLK